MTLLQIFNSFFYILIYPFLIRKLGASGYGLYVFALSIVTYFITIVNFGFDMPGVKAISQHPDDKEMKEHTLSCIFTAKIYIELMSLFVFFAIIFSISPLRKHWDLYSICFLQTIAYMLFPQWYFQGIQCMRSVTCVQLFYKLLSLPFIFLFVKNANNLLTLAFISSISSVLGGLTAFLMIIYKDKLQIKWKSFSNVKTCIKESFPFFISTSTGILKEQSIIIIIGSFLNMYDVAIYDLANKIIMVPRTLFASINGALFPKIIMNIRANIIKKIIKLETLIGISAIIFFILFGKWIVKFLGGNLMIDAYPIAIILSFTILAWLVVGAYIYFIFIPNNKYYFVTKNQFIAMLSFFIYAFIGFIFIRNVYILAIAISLSGITEIVYCSILAKKIQFPSITDQ